jgi:hypothetical protein
MILAPSSRLDPASRGVLTRLGLKLLLVVGFGVFGRIGNGLVVLTFLLALISGGLAIWHRERLWGESLNYWDEAIAFFAVCYVVRFLRIALGG